MTGEAECQPTVIERVMNDQATDEVERLFSAAIGIIARLRDGLLWPLPERADGFRYWSKQQYPPYVWEPLTDAERAVIEWMEAR